MCGGRAVETMKQKHVVVQTNPNPSQSQAKPSQGQAKPRSQSQTLGTSTSRLSGGEGELRPQALCLRLPQTTTRPGQSAPSILLAGACLGKSIETRSRDSNLKNSKTRRGGLRDKKINAVRTKAAFLSRSARSLSLSAVSNSSSTSSTSLQG